MESSRNGNDPSQRPALLGQYRPCRLPIVLIIILISLIYSNALNGQWHFDDYPNILENTNVHAVHFDWQSLKPSLHGLDFDHKSYSRPLAFLSFAMNYAIGGDNPRGYVAVNIVIHLLTAVVLFMLVRALLRMSPFQDRWGRFADSAALLTAVLWSSHPIQVTAVTYIVQRMASLAGLLVLVAMGLYVIARTSPTRKLRWISTTGCIVSAIAALSVKENAALLPINFLLIEWLVIRGGRWWQRRTLIWGAAVVATILVGIGAIYTDLSSLLANYDQRPFTLGERLLTQPRVIFMYLGQLAFPVSQQFTLMHGITFSENLLTPWTTLPAIVGIIGIVAAGIGIARRAPLASFSILFFLVNHLIESSFLPLELIFEHRNYIPSMFLFLPPVLFLLILLERLDSNRWVQSFACLGMIGILIAQADTTYHRNRLFSNPILLWEDNVAKAPGIHRPLHNLGTAYLKQGAEKKGMAILEKSLTLPNASNIHQAYLSLFNMGDYAFRTGDFDSARSYLEAANTVTPNHVPTLHSLALLYHAQGHLDLSEASIRRAIALDPKSSDHHALLSLVLLRQNRVIEAKKSVVEAMRLPRNADGRAYFVLGEIAYSEGRKDIALQQYLRYSQFFPNQLIGLLFQIEILDAQNATESRNQTVKTLLAKLGTQSVDSVFEAYRNDIHLVSQDRLALSAEAIHKTFIDWGSKIRNEKTP